jgi:hypothetical protein
VNNPEPHFKSARLATPENGVVRSLGRDRMKFSFPRGAEDGPGIRITPKRGADVRQSFTRGCAARCCSGRSLKCQPTRPPNQMTSLVHVNQRRLQAAAFVVTQGHLRGRMAGGCGFWTAAKRTGFSPNCSSIRSPVATSKSGARPIGGHERPPVRSWVERSSEADDERKRQHVGSRHGS